MFLIKVEGSEGEMDNVCYLILRTLIISLVNIVDLVLAILIFIFIKQNLLFYIKILLFNIIIC